MSGEIVKVGSTVRRPTGPHTPTIHRLLHYLDQAGFSGSPKAHGIDGHGREVLDYLEGPVVWPDATELVSSDAAMREVAIAIRQFHAITSQFERSPQDSWSDRAADPSKEQEVICHNDIAPWNLIRTKDSWVFIDWDFAAPGRRIWDLAWTAHTLVPLWPDSGLYDSSVARRLVAFLEAYGIDSQEWTTFFEVVIERTGSMARVIRSRGALGEEPFETLLKDGHADAWQSGSDHVAVHWRQWKDLMGGLTRLLLVMQCSLSSAIRQFDIHILGFQCCKESRLQRLSLLIGWAATLRPLRSQKFHILPNGTNRTWI
jgi:aminoglycoside phosphotransferase (APT) family kinase protein